MKTLNNKEFKNLKDTYMNIEIPDNLDEVVNDALNNKSIKIKRKQQNPDVN